MSEGSIMVITGTRKGIGKYLAEYYVKKGFQVVGCSRGEIDFEQDNYRHFCLDVSDEQAVRKMFSDIRKVHGGLDVLINNAGITLMNHVLLTPMETVRKILNTNISGTFLFCREAVKLMQKKRCGRIVNISSVHVPQCTVGTSMYGASKASTDQFSKVLAREIFQLGITVNTLALSVVKKSGMAENLPEKSVREILSKTISKSPLSFDDITHAMDFLISKESKMITSQVLYLGGV